MATAIQPNSDYALAVIELSKTYNNGLQALDNINITIKRGDFFALLGPNGAGKSTLISILTSLVRKTSGRVYIFGYDIDRDFAAAKSCLGVVPQEFNFNIFESPQDILLNQAGYYGIPRKVALMRCEHYLRQLHLWKQRHQTSRSLSGGMKRRLMIARALLHQPKMIILDEPTAGVDIEIRHSIWEFLTQLNQEQGITIILTTHYLEEAERLCRNIAIIDHGHIIADSNMNDLLGQLAQESFFLFLRKPLTELPVLKDYTITVQDDQTLEVEVPRQQGVTRLLMLLQQHGIEVISMRNKSTQLEQLFLTMTKEQHAH